MNYAVWELRFCELFSYLCQPRYCLQPLVYEHPAMTGRNHCCHSADREQSGREEFSKAKVALRGFMVLETN